MLRPVKEKKSQPFNGFQFFLTSTVSDQESDKIFRAKDTETKKGFRHIKKQKKNALSPTYPDENIIIHNKKNFVRFWETYHKSRLIFFLWCGLNEDPENCEPLFRFKCLPVFDSSFISTCALF